MARRKRQILDDGDDSDSSKGSEDDANDFGEDLNDPDERAERALFNDPYGHRKRRRTNGKNDTTYGVFGEDSEDEGFGGRKKRPEKRSDWTKAPAFVTSDKKVEVKEDGNTQTGDGDDDEVKDDESDSEEEDDCSDGSTNESRPPSPRIRMEEVEDGEVEKPRLGGIGSNATFELPREEKAAAPSFNKGGIGSKRGGIGSKAMFESPLQEGDILPSFSKGRVGSKTTLEQPRQDEDTAPSFKKGGIGSSRGGIGSKTTLEQPGQEEVITPTFSKGGIGSSKGGLGSTNKSSTKTSMESTFPSVETTSNLPSSFGMSRPQRSFVRDESGRTLPPSAAPNLTAEERIHFSKLEGSYGARMLSKMGWQTGTALGLDSNNIVIPIQPKLRPKGAGLAFRGFKEKSEQSKAEARRRGEVVSSDEDEKAKKRGKSKVKSKGTGAEATLAQREETWKKPKKSKLKIKHKTYEEIVAEAGEESVPSAGIGKIIDATGATLREVSSLADISIGSWTPSADPMRIPEVRHNLRLIAESCKTELDGLAKEAKTLEDRKKWVQNEDPRLRRKVENEVELIKRLREVHLVVDEINTTSRDVSRSDYEPSLDVFSKPINRLLSSYSSEYDRYRIDEIVVAAMAPTFRRMMASWQPLVQPTAYTSTLRTWRNALKMASATNLRTTVDVYGTVTILPSKAQIDELPMTPFESLLWNVWLPRIRSCITNEWSPNEPLPAVGLYEAWSDILPPFLRDNLLDQLILPKVSSTISAWNPKKTDVSLQSIVFPWLPHVGLRMEQFVDDARRKVKSLMRAWSTSDGVPDELLPWKEVFNSADWEELLLKYVLPKLGATLRDDFRINPRNQNMVPLTQVLQWSAILRSSTFGHLLQVEFFPKWLDILHIWLVQPSVNFGEVAKWYEDWKGSFPEGVQTIPVVEQGFTRGLQMMHHALELGAEAPKKLPKPDHKGSPSASTPLRKSGDVPSQRHARPSRTQEITFRSIVEEFVSQHNLLFMPAGKVDEKSRLPLFRVSKAVDGKGGVLVYLLDDAVWAASTGDEDYRAITLDDMVLRATKG